MSLTQPYYETNPCFGIETSEDDIHDSPDDLAKWSRLAHILLVCQDGIERAYIEADKHADHCQTQHKYLTIIAAAAGSFAVIAAILQLNELWRGFLPMPRLEGIAALIALGAVVAGILLKRQPAWFLARHKAERYRFLKFHFLTEPDLWIGTPRHTEVHIRKLNSDIEEIRDLDRAGLRTWAEHGMIPQAPAHGASCLATPFELRELVDYYVKKRLCNQMRWFNKRAQQFSKSDRVLKHLSPWLFFGSVFAALIHFLYDETVQSSLAPAQISILNVSIEVSVALILVAAILPVLGGGFRTLRSAYQFARNKSRYTATFEGLKPSYDALRAELEDLKAAGVAQISGSAAFYHMWRCEQILEAEHREWLRLMMQAEWFG